MNVLLVNQIRKLETLVVVLKKRNPKQKLILCLITKYLIYIIETTCNTVKNKTKHKKTRQDIKPILS